jgi:hypothetical protein
MEKCEISRAKVPTVNEMSTLNQIFREIIFSTGPGKTYKTSNMMPNKLSNQKGEFSM